MTPWRIADEVSSEIVEERVRASVLEGEGWTTALVDQEFSDPLGETEGSVARVFPFLEIDPVDARLLPRIERDQIAIMGRRKAAAGAAGGEASLVHVALVERPGSIVLSNDPHAVGLGRRRRVHVRGTLYVMHREFSAGLLDVEEAWAHYGTLRDYGRRQPWMSRRLFDLYLHNGTDPKDNACYRNRC